jgi:hypothetical protein
MSRHKLLKFHTSSDDYHFLWGTSSLWLLSLFMETIHYLTLKFSLVKVRKLMCFCAKGIALELDFLCFSRRFLWAVLLCIDMKTMLFMYNHEALFSFSPTNILYFLPFAICYIKNRLFWRPWRPWRT